MTFLRNPLALAVIGGLLTACSGGGTSTSNDTVDSDGNTNTSGQTETVEVQRVSLTGLAVKGTAIGAKAELFRVINGQAEASAFANGTTDDNGRYTLDAVSDEAYSGPALVKISWQEGAEMVCDADGCGNFSDGDERDTNTNSVIDFGERYDLPRDFVMSAFVPHIATDSDDDTSYTANITSLTHIAAQYAAGQSGLDEELIRKLNNRVRLLFGLSEDALGEVDLLLTSPLDPTGIDGDSDPLQIAYGLITGALAQVAADSGKTVDEILAQFAENFADNSGQLNWNDGTSGELTIQQILQAAKALAGTAGYSGLDTEFDDEISATGSKSGVSDLVPPVSRAGADQVVTPGQTQVTLSGSSDTTGVSYLWSQVSGTPVTLSGTTTASVTFTAPLTTGNLEFALKVTDPETTLTDIDRIVVSVKASAGDNTSVAGKYRAYIPGMMLSSSASANEHTEVDSGLNVTSNITVKAATGSTSGLSVTIAGPHYDWRLENSYSPGSFFSTSGAPAKSLVYGYLTPEVGSESFTLSGSVYENGNIQLTEPTSYETDDSGDGTATVHVSYGTAINFLPLVDGNTYLASHVYRSEGYAANSDGTPNLSSMKYRDSDVESILLVKNNADFAASKFADQYGMITLTTASDETFSQIVTSELQTWAMTYDATVPSVISTAITSNAGLSGNGKVKTQYIHDLIISEGVYVEPSNHFTVSSSSESETYPSGEPGEIVFAVDSSKSGQFRVPSSQSSALLGDNSEAILEGMASGDGSFIMATLLGQTSNGTYAYTDASNNQTNQALQANLTERYIGIKIDGSTIAASDFMNKTFAVQGFTFGLNADDRGPEVSAFSGSMSFDSTGTHPLINVSEKHRTVNNSNFTLVRLNEVFSSSSDVQSEDYMTAEFGAGSLMKIYNNSDTTLEGFVSTNKDLFVLRILVQGETDGSQGYVIGRLVE
ncbi:PKD domain-containing protein [Thalassolituus sp. LLYu03]|uniref:PKD domain-containing protein n=1 Tax=Thalassolituus sp. LLYu03 TaxID=3421656 RepID=UPI003D2AB307